jgi:3-hydroxy-9,10-secoandrosta-1,3,5(10)-triene-9,17-dione monooxygenase
MLPKESISIDHESWEVSGLRGTGSKELVIAGEVLVPAHRVLRVSESMNRESPGQKLYDHPLYMTPWRTTAILVLAAPLIGAAKAAIGRFQERMDNHVLLALKTTQLNDPLALNRLAESSAEIQAAELMLYHAAKQLDLLGAADKVDPLYNAVIIRDCGFAVRLLANSVDRLFEASGGSALASDEPMQRIWRDVHAARSHAVLTWDHASHTYSQALFK